MWIYLAFDTVDSLLLEILLPCLSWYFSLLILLVSSCLFLLILLHGFLFYKILKHLYMIPSHIITSYISFPYSQYCLYLKISPDIKTPTLNCLLDTTTKCLMGISSSSFIKWALYLTFSICFFCLLDIPVNLLLSMQSFKLET